ncbi:MAG TPA: site-2 protease family protein [Thermoanaerobaculia bacterium]|jgi:membrane-associated protease RseP (regulator of RpoE activity)
MLLASRTDVTTDLAPYLSAGLVRRVWTDPALRALGLSFSLPLLAILLAHELGHYVACRRYGLPATLPYFLPLPAMPGTMGAFIRIKAPLASRRQLFDVGFAGPAAGFVTLLPFLLLGIARSRIAAIPIHAGSSLLLPGRCLAIQWTTLLFHRPLRAGETLDLHPFALAAWLGLLATALNLLPLSQLDGGHILYAAAGRRQRLVALPCWLALVLAGRAWPGWWLWCAIVLVMGLEHPPLVEEATPLGATRRGLALVALAMLVLAFMPVPLRWVGPP